MLAIPSPMLALARAFDRFELSTARMLDATQGVNGADLESALNKQSQALVEVKASVATVRFAEDLWQALLEIGKSQPLKHST